MFGTKIEFPPRDRGNVSGAGVGGEGYKTSTDGVKIYLNAGGDLKNVFDRVEDHNGKIITPKTQVSREMGYFAMFNCTKEHGAAFDKLMGKRSKKLWTNHCDVHHRISVLR